MTAMIVMPSGLAVLQCWLYLAGIVVQHEALTQQAGRENLSFSQGQRHRFLTEADQAHQQLSQTPQIKLYAANTAECDGLHRPKTKAARLQSQTQPPWPRVPQIMLYAVYSAEYDRMRQPALIGDDCFSPPDAGAATVAQNASNHALRREFGRTRQSASTRDDGCSPSVAAVVARASNQALRHVFGRIQRYALPGGGAIMNRINRMNGTPSTSMSCRANCGCRASGLSTRSPMPWGCILQDPMTTTAAIDRLVHHASILEPRESVRGEEVCKRNAVQKIKERPTPTKGKEDIAEEVNKWPCVQTTYIDASAGGAPQGLRLGEPERRTGGPCRR